VAGSASAGLGLCSAAFWGGSDFAGGWGSRRAPALLIVTSGQIVSGAFLLVLCFAQHIPAPPTHYAVLAVIGGFEGALSLVIFYRALAIGAMGLTAALTGLLTALIPVLYSFFSDGLPAPVNIAGLATGCAAIWFISQQAQAQTAAREPGPGGNALLLGTLSGIGFGCQLVLLKMASNGGVLWSLTWTRIAEGASEGLPCHRHTRGSAGYGGQPVLHSCGAGRQAGHRGPGLFAVPGGDYRAGGDSVAGAALAAADGWNRPGTGCGSDA